jgi:basic membrane protein A
MIGRGLFGLALLALAQGAAAQTAIRPAVLYDLGARNDQSFNQSVFDGATRFKAETGIDFVERQIERPDERIPALTALARAGHDPIVAVSFRQEEAVRTIAAQFPATRFVLIDGVVELPNVKSVLFKEHEGAFLVGRVAALLSTRGVVGFIGGMNAPVIRRFECGFLQGAHSTDKTTRVVSGFIAADPSGFRNPEAGGRLAQLQMSQGADVVFAAAGGSGIGVIEAAARAGTLAIGVDSNQNHVRPGTVATSMLKRVDVATYRTLNRARDGSWEAGIDRLGLAEGGVDWAVDRHNALLIDEAVFESVEAAKREIVAGRRVVLDINATGQCPLAR